MTKQQRDESGEFTEKVTDQDVLKVFDAADAPVLTAGEIADELPITREAVGRRLESMHVDGLVGRKQTGARAVAWWAMVAPDHPSETATNSDDELAEEVTDQDVLKVFDAADAPVLTAEEIATKLSATSEAVFRQLGEMLDNGVVGRKLTGNHTPVTPESRLVSVWWAKVAPRLSPEARQRADAADPATAVSLNELETEFYDDA